MPPGNTGLSSQGSIRLAALLLCTMSCVFALGSAVATVLTPSQDDSEFVFPDNVEYLPQYFAVPIGYDTSRKTVVSPKKADSWIFSVISVFESFYRRQSYMAGGLPQDKAVTFSEQALIHSIELFCANSNSSSTFCKERSLPQNVNIFENLALSSEINHGIMPSAVCNYDSASTDCSGYDTKASLEWTYNVTRWGRTSQEMKEMLFTSGAPLLLSMPEPLVTYYIPCSDARVSNTKECIGKTVKCRNGDGYCGILRFPSYSAHGDFRIPQEPAVLQPGDPMSFVVVGYVNSYIATQVTAQDRGFVPSEGGFIALAPMLGGGMSVNHYLGLIRQTDSYLLCANWQDPYMWPSANISCVREKKALEECISLPLKCINSSLCDVESDYTLMQMPVRAGDVRILFEDSGMTVTPMFRRDKSGKVTEEIFNKLPFHRLSEAFTYPFESGGMDSTCGYWFIPFEMIEKLNALNGGFNNRVTALQVEIQFESKCLYGQKSDKVLSSLLSKSVTDCKARVKTLV